MLIEELHTEQTKTEIEYNEITDFLVATLREFGVCDIQFLKQRFALLQKQNKKEGKAVYQGKITDELFRTELKKVADTLHNLFYLRLVGDPVTDQYRHVILHCFKEQLTVRRQDVMMAARKILGKNIPQNYYQKIMTELAYTTKKSKREWIFKSGSGNDGGV